MNKFSDISHHIFISEKGSEFMIKGINKQVLEIIETNNGYFEKALFFVKPEYSGYSENKLREMAQNEISNALIPPKQRHNKKYNKLKIILSAFSIFIFGVILGFLVSFIV